jgi:hypothetical protein
MLPIYLHFFLSFLYDIVYYCYYNIPKLRDTHQYNNVIIIKTRVKKISDNIRLQHVVFGYTIFDKEYFHLNYFLAILAFTNYKSYYVSEQKTKKIDVFLLFKNEFQRKMKENKSLGINSLFKNILNKL